MIYYFYPLVFRPQSTEIGKLLKRIHNLLGNKSLMYFMIYDDYDDNNDDDVRVVGICKIINTINNTLNDKTFVSSN